MASISSSALISRGGMAVETIATAPAGKNAKIWAAAQDFEAMFLNTMLEPMFKGLGEEGPFGGGSSVETWRGMVVQEWTKSIASAGGLGMTDQIYNDILALQENRK
ncbi:rod-binding protein [Blastochloris viridis]|uniref:Chemotactic signal-response protein CheL n=1 Tax=Blastochloris viridis TaxID=1079 RepID=A0A0H5BCB7_BLAVI|nr:rod-binding protein [Blastochloris viridis]ALK08782.1 chemotactic signal-response protein CheL [Blastochloris viridis]BAR97921.1 flagellar protein FlgJ [peptidoglycan hydrolase] [Blastochloris viridis]CUU41443.1 chemotactic signal-response protein CheL [Blastochloris viridis]